MTMNKSFLVKVAIFLGLITMLTSCSDSNNIQEEKIDKANVLKMVLNVEGMTCEGCEKGIENSLAKLPGVVEVKASHIAKSTTVNFDGTKISGVAIEKAIRESGYKIIMTPQGNSENSVSENTE